LAQHDTVRAAFPSLSEVVYLNVGTYGIMPEPALQRFLHDLQEFERYGVASRSGLGRRKQEVRAAVADLLGAEPEELTLTGNATDGTNLVLAGSQWHQGDEIITTDEEHESIIHPLLYLQHTRRVQIKQVQVSPDAEVMIGRCEEVASPRTRLLAFSQVSCETGTRLPAAELCEWAAQRDVASLVDSAQSLGVMPISVRALGCDFLTSNGHKWLGGPKGTGIFYAHQERLRELSLAHVGAGSLQHADISTGRAEPWDTGRRFEFGTRATALYAGLAYSIEWLEGLGWAAVEAYIADLSGYLKTGILEREHLRLLSPRDWQASSGLTTFEVVGHQAGEVSRALRDGWSIHVRVIPHYNALRISTAHFNCREDVDTLLAAVDAIVSGS
jgi:selenocysteine lyase/cysteine desulfurase